MYKSIETYRGFVYPWVIDHVGHMNVQSYTARFDEASWQFLMRLGMSPSSMRENGRSFVAMEQRTQYRREVLGGALLHIATELIKVGRSSVRFVHRMFDSETNAEVAVTELTAVYFDTARRVSAALPVSVALQAVQLLVLPDPSGDSLPVGLEPDFSHRRNRGSA
jgi:acyl-CoA thioester hydrolase